MGCSLSIFGHVGSDTRAIDVSVGRPGMACRANWDVPSGGQPCPRVRECQCQCKWQHHTQIPSPPRFAGQVCHCPRRPSGNMPSYPLGLASPSLPSLWSAVLCSTQVPCTVLSAMYHCTPVAVLRGALQSQSPDPDLLGSARTPDLSRPTHAILHSLFHIPHF